MRIKASIGLLLLVAANARADNNFAVDARHQGLGNAVVALAEGSGALSANPAGLGAFPQRSLTVTRRTFLNGLDDNSSIGANAFSYVAPRWGVAYNSFQGADYYDDQQIGLGYSFPLSSFKFGAKDIWTAGVALHYQSRRYQPNVNTANALDDNNTATGQADPLFAREGFSSNAYGVDAGLMVRVGNMTGGLSASNINRPSLALSHDGGMPSLLRLGLARTFSWGLVSVEARQAKRIGSTDGEWGVGVEKNFLGKTGNGLVLRTGFEQGAREFSRPTGGFTVRTGQLDMSYSFSVIASSMDGGGADHAATLTYRFDRP